MINVVDTHALIWFLAGDARLGEAAKKTLTHPESALVLPVIVLAEAYWTIGRGRTALSATLLRGALQNDLRFVIAPLTQEIVERSNSLTDIVEMHDRQIVATTLVLIEQGNPAALLTADLNITASRIVPIIW